MAERRVGIGSGNSYLDIGIEPPIDDETAQAIIDKLETGDFPRIFPSFWSPSVEQNIGGPDAHTVISFNTDDAHRAFPEEFVFAAQEIARRVTRQLVVLGETVETLPEIVQIDFQTPIFGTDADNQRELARNFEAKHR